MILNQPSRRDFLAAATLASSRFMRGQARAAGARAIDLHHHFVSPAYVKALAAKDGHHAAKHLQGLEKCGFTPAELAGIQRENASL
ncbi:MAG: hypothetical protein C5B51_10625 [Terriglobia bacterium]|nr:MAG: hypothetical protein C5B51_10625 [Terriglobia bacterium]